MRIIEMVPRFPPAVGGTENHVYNISVELTKRGHKVIIVTSNDIDGEKDTLIKEVMSGVEVHRYPLFLSRVLREFWLIPGLLKAFRNLRGDVVHVHGYRYLSSCIATFLSKLKGIPIVLTPHGIYPSRTCFNGFMKFLYDHFLGYLLLKFSDRIIALTENNKILLLRIGAPKNKVVMIPNGVDINKYKSFQRAAKETEGKYKPMKPVLIHVGRIDWNKQLEKIIEALPLITDRFPDTKFLIVGPDSGKYSMNLRYLAKNLGVEDSVVITGSVPEKEKLLCYSTADIFMLPSLYEGLSLSLLEAMASKVPVIALSSGGTGDVLTHGVNAFLLKEGSPKEIFDSVNVLLNSPDLREKILQNAFNLVVHEYTWKAVVDKLELLYKEVSINSRKPFEG